MIPFHAKKISLWVQSLYFFVVLLSGNVRVLPEVRVNGLEQSVRRNWIHTTGSLQFMGTPDLLFPVFLHSLRSHCPGEPPYCAHHRVGATPSFTHVFPVGESLLHWHVSGLICYPQNDCRFPQWIQSHLFWRLHHPDILPAPLRGCWDCTADIHVFW